MRLVGLQRCLNCRRTQRAIYFADKADTLYPCESCDNMTCFPVGPQQVAALAYPAVLADEDIDDWLIAHTARQVRRLQS